MNNITLNGGCMCLECKYAEVLTDNKERYHNICVCQESDNFLKEVEIAFDSCEYGRIDDYGTDE